MRRPAATALRTGNPALTERVFTREAGAGLATGTGTMTIQGTVDRTALLLLIALLTGAATWVVSGASGQLTTWVVAAAIAGLVVAFVTAAKRRWAPVTAPLYAALEGVVLGGVSKAFEAAYPGIALQAVMLTAATLGGMLLIYRTRLIRPTRNFWLGVAAATFAVMLVYLVSLVLSLGFGVRVSFLYDASPLGIGFSLLVVGIAALNLVLDFDFIETGARAGSPRYMEWYAAFGLMVTLVWLYLEILRLLAKLRER